MLTVVCCLWRDPGYRYGLRYGPEHVNRLRRMVRRHLSMPHRFVALVDDPVGIDEDIETIPLWPDHRDMGGTWCRVRLFASEMRRLLGERFVLLDLDVVVTGALDPLFDRPEEFVTGVSYNPAAAYNTGTYLLTAGSRAEVWDRFSPAAARRAVTVDGMWEQGWASYILGAGEATWGVEDGVYEYGRHVARGNGGALPANARLVAFSGPHDPSLPACQALSPWIAEHWM